MLRLSKQQILFAEKGTNAAKNTTIHSETFPFSRMYVKQVTSNMYSHTNQMLEFIMKCQENSTILPTRLKVYYPQPSLGKPQLWGMKSNPTTASGLPLCIVKKPDAEWESVIWDGKAGSLFLIQSKLSIQVNLLHHIS